MTPVFVLYSTWILYWFLYPPFLVVLVSVLVEFVFKLFKLFQLKTQTQFVSKFEFGTIRHWFLGIFYYWHKIIFTFLHFTLVELIKWINGEAVNSAAVMQNCPRKVPSTWIPPASFGLVEAALPLWFHFEINENLKNFENYHLYDCVTFTEFGRIFFTWSWISI